MRRAERQVTDLTTIRSIIDNCKVMRLAMQDEKGLYIVPVNFGYHMTEDGTLRLYLHSAGEGRKVKVLSGEQEIAVEMDCSHQLVKADQPCNFSYFYQSLTGTGVPEKLENPEEKKRALNKIMLHQEGKEFEFSDAMVSGVAVFEITVKEYSVKQHV